MADDEPTPTTPPGDAGRPPRRVGRRATLALALLAVGLALDALLLEPAWFEVTTHAIGDGPREVRVLHLTDLHVGAGHTLDRVLAEVRALAPDLIVITGDSVIGTRDVTPADAAAVVAVLRQLQAPLGVYACPGNHEAWAGTPGYQVYPDAGVPLLSHDAVSLLGGALVVHGRELPSDPVEPTPGFDVLLCHYPVALERGAAQPGVELVLAGHTHGGQVRLPGWGALWLPSGSGRYEQGWYERGGTRMYVSRGVGTSILPLRFACRPELTLITLRLPAASAD